MTSQNKIILIGRLTADPEIRVTTEGNSLTKFTLGVDRSFGEDKTDFINIVSWGKVAEQGATTLHKGRLALVEGRIQVRSYDDKDGEKVWGTEVVASFMRAIEGGAADEAAPVKAADAPTEEFTEDDIPF